jgi:hypothetical protein
LVDAIMAGSFAIRQSKTILAALVSQLAFKVIERREDEARKLGVLPKKQIWNRHDFAARSGARTGNHQ